MANDKVITREEDRSFDRYLFETDFFEVDVLHEAEHVEEVEQELEASAEEPEAEPQPEEAPAPKVLTEEDLAQAESAGYAAGLNDGKTQAAEDLKTELKTHTDAFSKALSDLDTLKDEVATDIAQKSLTLMAELLPSLLADAREKYPEALLKRAADLIADTLKTQNVLVVKTAPETTDYLLKRLGKVKGITDHLKTENFIETPTLEVGDCIIEWQTGGTTLNHDDILQQLQGILTGAGTTVQKPEKEAIKTEPAAEAPQGDPQTELPKAPQEAADPAPETAAEPTPEVKEAEKPKTPAEDAEDL